ncbi:MAG TPA: PEP-utilizing enzyme [Thermomicrobiaceae bacterium]|nr:PEP-utilizing enzyme [Thermomicrobiaceae bacterium]
MVSIEPAERRIPIQPDFPVTWEEPGDEQQFWTMDLMHFPRAVLPLEEAAIRLMYNRGLDTTGAALDMPIRLVVRRFGGYHYQAIVPRGAGPEEMEALGASFERKIGAAMASLRQDWENRYLPEVRQLVESSAALDYEAADLAKQAEYLNTVIERSARLWVIHFLLVLPIHMARSLFEEFYREIFDESDPLKALRLLQGLDNLTLQMGRELWQLSRAVKASPDVLAIFQTRAPGEVVAALGDLAPGHAFLADFHRWLEQWGYGSASLGITTPTWIENPTDVIRMLQDYLARGDHDPAREQEQPAADREVAVAEARAKLENYPEPVREQFEAFLTMAQDANVIHEDHNHWIDFRGNYELRRVALATGRKLAAAGVLGSADDVEYLTLDELHEAAANPTGRDWRSLAAERATEMERYRALTPPAAIGSMPPGPPPDNALARTFGKFFGVPPQPSTEADTIKGAAASAGTMVGPVKVLRSLADADKLQQGDVMVVTTTTPPWTPLFNTAGAVVSDTGGMLSHCAVVAREYSIPAVVGTGVGTRVLHDGQLVEVDGTAGTVRIVSG